MLLSLVHGVAAQSETATPTLTPSPSTTATPTPPATTSPTPSPTASVTPSITSSPTPSPSASTTLAVVVLRVGDPAGVRVDASRPTRALPLFADWYDVESGTRFRSVAVRGSSETILNKRHRACTLGAGTAGVVNFHADGLPSNTVDGRLMVWPCYDVPAGSGLSFSSPRTIAVLDYNGEVDTRMGGRGASGAAGAGTGWRQVATVDGSSFWAAAMGASAAGFRYIERPLTSFDSAYVVSGRGAPGGARQPGYNDARGLLISSGPFTDGVLRLWGSSSSLDGSSWSTVFSLSSGTHGGLPRTAGSGATALPGVRFASGSSPWGFLFDADGWLWLSLDRPGSDKRGVLQGWARPAGASSWALQTTSAISADPLRSLTGRYEGGRGFVLYATSTRTLYRYFTRSAELREVVARPPTGAVFRGVALPPSADGAAPSPSRTRTPSRTRSRSQSRKPRMLR